MTIALDARFASEKTGTGKVSYNIIKNILLKDKTNKYILLCFNTDPFKEIKRENLERIVSTWSRKSIKRPLWEFFYLPRLLRKEKVDIFFSPENFMAVPFWKGKQLVTILDLIPLVFPNYIKQLRRKIRFNLKVSTALKHYSRIVTISHFSKLDIVRVLKVQPKKISLMSMGAEIEKLPPSVADKLVLEDGVKNKYILAVGGLEFRKNNTKLIKAYSKLPADILNKYDLVIVGPLSDKVVIYSAYPKISAYIMGRVHFVGRVSDKKLTAYYQKASLFVYLSLYEGFGLPLIEAMKFGIPIVSSDDTSLPEVAGDAAVIVNSEKAWNVTNGMMDVLKNDERRNQLIQEGYKQSRKYSWEIGAMDIINIFNSL